MDTPDIGKIKTEIRELIRQSHEVIKDLRQANREAREAKAIDIKVIEGEVIQLIGDKCSSELAKQLDSKSVRALITMHIRSLAKPIIEEVIKELELKSYDRIDKHL